MSDLDLENFSWNEHEEDSENLGPVPPGDYICFVQKFERTHKRGKLQLDITIKIKLNARTEQRVDGITWETVTLKKDAIWKLVQLFRALKAPTTINLNSDRAVAEAIKNKAFKAKIIVEEYRGKKRNKVEQFVVPSESDGKLFDKIDMSSRRSSDPGYDEGMEDTSYSSSDDEFTDDDIPF